MRLYWTLSYLTELTQLNTKRSIDSLTMHSHPFNAMSPCICNARCHCMLYHATCIMNATWATQPTPLTGCHGQSHQLHMTSINHFIHVNITYKHISTFTFNMSVYNQVMTHTHASHVMITHKNSSYVKMLEYTYWHPNRSLHYQVVAHSQSSHVMAIYTYKLITCQHVRAHIFTSKHVTFSQEMTHLNKSHNGPRSKPQ